MFDDILGGPGVEVKPYRVHICLGPNCTPKGSPALLQQMNEVVWRLGLQDKVEVIGTSCRDRCEDGPSINVYPGPVFYNHIDMAAIEEIAAEHLTCGRVVEHLVFRGKPRR